MERHPIVITGMHRSGTSMVTRSLHESGLHLLGPGADEFLDAADDNPEGFWENKAVVACNDDLLEAVGGAWDNPPALPPQGADDPRVRGVAEAAEVALAGLREHRHWGFKDPRTCLTAPFWLDLEPDLRFVLCIRHPLEVALSLKRRNQTSYSLGLALWERYYSTILDSVPADRRITTHFDAFFRDPEGELARLCAFAGLEPAEPHVRADLRHHDAGVTLDEAGVAQGVRALYGRLCEEAGVAVAAEGPADEATVRRLVLDGVVARRHADQRQDAIDRLQEREGDHRARIRSLESQIAREKAHSEALESAVRQVADAVARTEATVTVLRRMADGSPLRQMIRRVEAAAVRRGQRYVIHPGRRVLHGGPGAAVPTAVAAARHLPAPARSALRQGGALVRRRAGAAAPRARAAARRLPPPAQTALRRGEAKVARLRDRPPAPKLGPVSSPAPPIPRGAPFPEWKAGYEELVRATLPPRAPWLVVTPGSPREVRLGHAPRGTPFPTATKAQPQGRDLASIAQLEALRFSGHQRLVLPEGSRPWFGQRAELRAHVSGRYPAIADREHAGAVFDLTRPAETTARSLRAEVADMAAGAAGAPAVLDWTDLGIADELPGFTTFGPPESGSLPYLDASIEIVVTDGGHDEREAARVASLAVLTVDRGPAGAIEVRHIERLGDVAPAPRPRTLVVSTDPGAGSAWPQFLADSIAGSGAELRFGPIDAGGLSDGHEFDAVVVVEPCVCPLPGSIEAAAALATADPGSAVAGKILAADGTLEAAGGTVFTDRSAALIGFGSADVRAPWHEYVRPVCWAPGIVAAASSLWTAVEAPVGFEGRAFLREWCSAVWAGGHDVRYHPPVAAVRVAGRGDEPAAPLAASSWQRVLDLRPQRPRDLSEGAWRSLLGHDDVEACRR